MTPKELEIARAFVACGRWVWLPGMRGHDRYVFFRVVERFHDGFLVRFRNPPSRQHKEHRFWDNSALNPPLVPDINDPATLGCILRLVRDAHGIPWLSLVSFMTTGGIQGWRVQGSGALDFVDLARGAICKTEAEALLRALQAAPEAS